MFTLMMKTEDIDLVTIPVVIKKVSKSIRDHVQETSDEWSEENFLSCGGSVIHNRTRIGEWGMEWVLD